MAIEIQEIAQDPEAKLEDYIGFKITDVTSNIVKNRFEIVEVEVDLKYYIPMFDPLGPYMIYPSQCYPDRSRRASTYFYNAPVIGYIPTGSEVEKDMLSQLESLFKLQRAIVRGES